MACAWGWTLRSRGIVALVLALSLVACRELTAPVQPNEAATVLAQGIFVRADGSPLTGARVRIHPQANELRYTFVADVTTDPQGRFEAWVPNLPMHVYLYPNSRTGLPDLDESNVNFRLGEVQSFVLKGDFYSGAVLSDYSMGLLSGANIAMRTSVLNAEGDLVYYSNSVELGDDGRFEIFLPQDGHYEASLNRCCNPQISFTWPDSIEIVRGDTLRLVAPLVAFELALQLGGNPIPSQQEFQCITGFWQNGKLLASDYEGDGSKLLFDVVGLEGATMIGFSSYNSGTSESPRFVRFYLSIPPLKNGDQMNLELGQYLFEIHVVDPMGNSLSNANVLFYGEDSLGSATGVSTQSDGRAYYRLNAGGFHLRVTQSGFYPAERYFSLNGDSQMEIEMQPTPSEN